MRISPEILYRCEADVVAPAEGSIWQRPTLRGRADSPGPLAQGMLHRDGPGTEESSSSPVTPGGPPLAMGREVRATEGRPQEARKHGRMQEQSYNPIVPAKVGNRRAPASSDCNRLFVWVEHAV